MESQPHWHILGAGAIGSLWAAYWALDNQATTAIVRSPAKKLHLTLHHHNNSFSFTQYQVNHAELNTPIKHLLITTKAHQTINALNTIAPLLSDDATVIVLQNGLAAENIQLSPNQTLIAATTTDGAHFKDNLNLYHIGPGQTYIGAINNKQSKFFNERQQSLLELLPTGLNVKTCDNIEERLWQKFAINCAINALGVKHQCTNGELVTNPLIRKELADLCAEISEVTTALKPDFKFQALYPKVAEVAEITAGNINSTLQDIRQRKESEIKALNGYLCLCAKKESISTPLNEALVKLVLQQEKYYQQP
ncbi:MAG: 2-dehydropantoate 2-reductase [Pseudohongiellaceae bacterium]|jgi:2-dehydropantoate 2-reductase